MLPGVSGPSMPGPAVDFGVGQGAGTTPKAFRALYCQADGAAIIKNSSGSNATFPAVAGQTIPVGGNALEVGTTGTFIPLY